MHSEKLNWTQLFSSVSRCVLNRRRNRRSSQVLHNRDTLVNRQSMQCLSLDENWWRAATTEVCRRPSPVPDCQELATGHCSSSPVQCTAENWTQLNSTIQSSSVQFLSASLYVSKRGAYWDRLCHDVVGRLSRACTVAKRCILGL